MANRHTSEKKLSNLYNRTFLACSVLAVLAGSVYAAPDDGNDALSRELLADAGARASFQAGGTAGHDGKFFLASSDGAFRLNVSGQMQFRYNFNVRDTTGNDKNITNGFHMRRAKISFDGQINPNIDFKVKGGFSRSSGTFKLEDAYGKYKFDNGMTVKWGQFKLPFLREENTSSSKQLTVDRSVANETFNQDYSQGVELIYAGDNFRVMGAISDGFNTDNTAFTSKKEADFAATARAELKFGDAGWKTFKDFTSFREGKTGGLVGVAGHWETFGNTGNTDTFAGTAVTGMDMFSYTADASYEGGGWNIYGAFIGRTIDPDNSQSFDDFGAVVQGGVFVSEKDELFARWDAVFPDSSRGANSDDFSTLTFGANHYFVPGSHAAKLTADVQWFLDDQAMSSSLIGSEEGIGLAPTNQNDEIAIRLQMQILF